MDFTVVIPARYSSTRLPGKPLKDIAGISMIQRVYQQAQKSKATQVIVATDDQRVVDEVKRFAGEVCLTSEDHQSGTDRLQEVATKYSFSDDHIIVNVQGDEPLIPPAVINQVADNLAAHMDAGVATLCEPIENDADFTNPNVVKVVADARGMALYFSRAPIPWPRDSDKANNRVEGMSSTLKPMRHIGIYAYRVAMLNHFIHWPMAPIEALECLEQLRFMWNGERIHVDQAKALVPGGVDTEEDLQRVISLLNQEQC
ncbi:MAG: 3-deoxy-manno-octulosonate cytidylyltransferase [Porticoccaceae bacterium]|nr:MAG: 3-deoxy-manno-octulosonate cytidylyltransferase [Porticoccaceae bacterium]